MENKENKIKTINEYVDRGIVIPPKNPILVPALTKEGLDMLLATIQRKLAEVEEYKKIIT